MVVEVEANIGSVKNKEEIETSMEKSPVSKNPDEKRRIRCDRSPIVKIRSVTGTIKWFSVRKGYGFIQRDDTDEDVFMHISSLVRQTCLPLALAENQEAEFDAIKGIEACCVSGKNGQRIGTIVEMRNRRMPSIGFGSRRNESHITLNCDQPQKSANNGLHREAVVYCLQARPVRRTSMVNFDE